jgi:hypothetical protein
VIHQSKARDLLLITDGKSHALDVQALARAGRRIVVVLVGEDSLEARVGHLAALTGGEIFVVAGEDLEAALLAAVASLRRPGQPPRPIEGPLTSLTLMRAGAQMSATWQALPLPEQADEGEARAIAALAAALALPALGEEAAATLAAAENLVTHLTSLVLVDEAGATQEGLPASRKIALPSPMMVDAFACMHAPTPDLLEFRASPAAPRKMPGRRMGSAGIMLGRLSTSARKPAAAPGGTVARIDWSAAPQALLQGDLSTLDPTVAEEVQRMAQQPPVIAAARSLGLQPVVLVLALMAWAQRHADRHAARFARRVLGRRLPREARDLGPVLGLTL